MTKRKEELKQEYSLNDRKKRYNRDCGTHAVVSDVSISIKNQFIYLMTYYNTQ